MLTDDDIASRLRSSFDRATADLHYTRRVTPPRPRLALVLTPVAGLVGAAAVGAVVVGQPAAAPRPQPQSPSAVPRVSASPSATASSAGPVAHVHLAGYTFTVPQAATGDDDLARIVLNDVAPVPAGARELPALPQAPGAKAWVGKYPGTQMQALWFRASTRNGGRLTAIIANSWTQDQLANVWASGFPDPR